MLTYEITTVGHSGEGSRVFSNETYEERKENNTQFKLKHLTISLLCVSVVCMCARSVCVSVVCMCARYVCIYACYVCMLVICMYACYVCVYLLISTY